MRRRQVLATALSVVSFAGCVAPSGSPDDSSPTDSPAGPASPTRSDPITPDPDDPIAIVLSNGTDATLTIRVTLRQGETVLLDRTETVGPDDRPELDTGIAETGDYTLAVAVDGGPAETSPFNVERYDIRMGSNLIAEITDEEIIILIEE